MLSDAADDVFEVKPWMINPSFKSPSFNIHPSSLFLSNSPGEIYLLETQIYIHFKIFNTQFKNMVNALFLSKSGGTKLFKCSKHYSGFGWDAIIAKYQCELGRTKQQQLFRIVLHLKKVYAVRDAWTKLNVSHSQNHAGKTYF